MKRFFLGSLLLLFVYALSLEAEEKEKELPLKLSVMSEGRLIIEEPVAFSLFLQNGFYILRPEHSEPALRLGCIYGNKFFGLIPEKVKLNYKEQKNPLYGAPLEKIALGKDENLCIIAQQDPATLYMITVAKPTHIAMISADKIHDAEGKNINGIAGLVAGAIGDESYTFLAVKKHQGLFGQTGSGIALLRYDPDIKKKDDKKDNKDQQDTEEAKTAKEKEQEESKPFFDILDANAGTFQGNKAYPLDCSTAALSIKDGVESIGEVIDMQWDLRYQRCYIALQVKTKNDARNDQGACALLVGRVENKKLLLDPIIPHSLVEGEKSVVGATGPDKYISLHSVRPMYLTNGLSYLVVVGGNGKPEETTQKVYAFPLVSEKEKSAAQIAAEAAEIAAAKAAKATAEASAKTANKETTVDKEVVAEEKVIKEVKHNTNFIAKKNNTPSARYNQGKYIMARVFEEPAIEKGDLFTSDDLAVQVGGAGVLPGPINDVTVQGDCVVVAVKEDGNGKAAGAFYSQAIINEEGIVVAWTSWQRVPGGDKKTLRVLPGVGQCKFLYTDGPQQFLHEQVTTWRSPQRVTNEAVLFFDGLQACIEKQFPPLELFGLNDYPAGTLGVSENGATSHLVALGFHRVVLLQTSERDEQGIVRPVQEYNHNKNKRFLNISDGALSTCGALSCSAIGVNDNQAWLFVGGSSGLAVLSHNSGSGWDARAGLGDGFSGINDDFAFKKLGNYAFIRKLAYCDNYLYVLTNKSLDRILITPEQCKGDAPLVVESLIDGATELHGKRLILQSFIVSPELLLVATSQGLYSAVPGSTISLNKIDLPHDMVPTNLFVVSRTGNENDFAHKGQLYVLARSQDYKETCVYRFFVDVSRENNIVACFSDCFRKDTREYWIRFAAPQQGFVTDGMSLYSYCSRIRNQRPYVACIVPPIVYNKNIIKAGDASHLSLNLENAHVVRAMVRDSATGSWLVAGDFGLRVNK